PGDGRVQLGAVKAQGLPRVTAYHGDSLAGLELIDSKLGIGWLAKNVTAGEAIVVLVDESSFNAGGAFQFGIDFVPAP
ncbi:MAG TPA: hypothetical protein VMB21_09560, partial [Candidatus Limnocylindria bacterium]|nr:hypothetical protein [Candidatus Limnocylindria bacterium]